MGTSVSDTETTTFIWSAPSMTATGMEVETKLFSTAFIVTSVPEIGAMTLPLESTFSRAVDSCWMRASLSRAACWRRRC